MLLVLRPSSVLGRPSALVRVSSSSHLLCFLLSAYSVPFLLEVVANLPSVVCLSVRLWDVLTCRAGICPLPLGGFVPLSLGSWVLFLVV
jgi:hypothetical protein